MSLPDVVDSGLSSLEQVGNLCETPRRPFIRGINHDERKAVFFKPRCKLWTCEACAAINKKLWAHRAFYGAGILQETAETINFLTLTSHEKLNATTSMQVWPVAWKKLKDRARYSAKGFQYLLVPEQHKDGRLHVHAIETAGLGKHWWKDNARECGLGYMAEEEEARTPGGAAYYVVKYLTKALEYQEWPRGFRRVRTSAQWPKPPEMPIVEGWEWEPLRQEEQLSIAIQDLRQGGYEVRILDHSTAWEYVKENAPE